MIKYGREALSILLLVSFFNGLCAKAGINPAQSIILTIFPQLGILDPWILLFISSLLSALSIAAPILEIIRGASINGIMGVVAVISAFTAGYLLPDRRCILALLSAFLFLMLTPSSKKNQSTTP
ncbi:MAG: hypothetical protein QW507_00040 [Candidatus Nanoarchaeia archaeon]|nr:hypothetical protein [Candidatus Haiyanarchaeum thermophilum]MCW1303027.1 hypothetical protein [Candidatus Haiyanarchaeum thermophilum]MCW1303705.1 hypothetical protein [Candidatus Haiyanarchaeum thermophilum]MCW1306385.1 hypothetical protein [Candidatus Haiyanarchaeum thermophilum]MCW1307105.1 hypothetical protein [Candidatus Haiyanarchaeum thermophilum]